MGRRAPTRMGNGHSVLTAVQRFYECSSHRRATGWTWRGLSHQGGRRAVATAAIVFYSPYFFGDGGAAGVGAFAAPAGAGEGAGLASSSSTSKIRVELAARSGLTDLSP